MIYLISKLSISIFWFKDYDMKYQLKYRLIKNYIIFERQGGIWTTFESVLLLNSLLLSRLFVWVFSLFNFSLDLSILITF